jgi:hypothetical protein
MNTQPVPVSQLLVWRRAIQGLFNQHPFNLLSDLGQRTEKDNSAGIQSPKLASVRRSDGCSRLEGIGLMEGFATGKHDCCNDGTDLVHCMPDSFWIS